MLIYKVKCIMCSREEEIGLSLRNYLSAFICNKCCKKAKRQAEKNQKLLDKQEKN